MPDVIPSSLLELIRERAKDRRPVLVGVAGAVAVGKSTFSCALAEATGGATRSTDGFLLPNAALEAAGTLYRKGFPESYDTDRMVHFLQVVRDQPTVHGLQRYSHETFDVEPDPEPFVAADLVIVEGVNALQPDYAPLLDVRVYLDADERHVIDWYTDRFRSLTQHARETGAGFYTRFVPLSPDELTEMAHGVWRAINSPNLHQHILPTRDTADVVIHKSADHSLRRIR
jgi:type I pantothenate kinase